MITSKVYYQKLYEHLLMNNKDLFNRCCNEDVSDSIEEPNTSSYKEFMLLLKQIEQKYGFEMHMNYKQLLLWQKSVQQDIDMEKAIIAGKLVAFCCLADNILDSRRFSLIDKKDTCTYIERFFQYDTIKENSGRFSELKMLSNDVLQFYENNHTEGFYHDLTEDLTRAFESELYMYRSPLNKKDLVKAEKIEILVDKSILFEKAAFLTASYGKNNTDSVRAAELIGEIFWIVDDLCDLIEDIHANRKNSMLFFGLEDSSEYSITERLQMAYENMDSSIDYLMNVLNELEKLVSADMFNFMIAQIWKWCFNVRKFAEH